MRDSGACEADRRQERREIVTAVEMDVTYPRRERLEAFASSERRMTLIVRSVWIDSWP